MAKRHNNHTIVASRDDHLDPHRWAINDGHHSEQPIVHMAFFLCKTVPWVLHWPCTTCATPTTTHTEVCDAKRPGATHLCSHLQVAWPSKSFSREHSHIWCAPVVKTW